MPEWMTGLVLYVATGFLWTILLWVACPASAPKTPREVWVALRKQIEKAIPHVLGWPFYLSFLTVLFIAALFFNRQITQRAMKPVLPKWAQTVYSIEV